MRGRVRDVRVTAPPRAEVESCFARWRVAVDARDLDAMVAMFTDDARGGNAIYGIAQGRDANGHAETHGEIYPGL